MAANKTMYIHDLETSRKIEETIHHVIRHQRYRAMRLDELWLRLPLALGRRNHGGVLTMYQLIESARLIGVYRDRL